MFLIVGVTRSLRLGFCLGGKTVSCGISGVLGEVYIIWFGLVAVERDIYVGVGVGLESALIVG